MPVERLRKGKRIVGTMVRMIRNPAVAMIAKNAGLDFIMIDMEHGSHSLEGIADIFKVARAVGLGSFVRVPELSKGYVSRIMDCGANGVMVPMIDSVKEAEALVAWTKYAPLGNRGLGSTGGHTGFGGMGGTAPEFMERANRETLSIAQIETVGAVEAIEEIAAIKGLDALLIGPNDLSISLGCPGDTTGTQVNEAIGKVAKAARNNKKIFGMHGPDALTERWIPEGLTLVMSALDINMITASFKAIADKFRE